MVSAKMQAKKPKFLYGPNRSRAVNLASVCQRPGVIRMISDEFQSEAPTRGEAYKTDLQIVNKI